MSRFIESAIYDGASLAALRTSAATGNAHPGFKEKLRAEDRGTEAGNSRALVEGLFIGGERRRGPDRGGVYERTWKESLGFGWRTK